jgi:signal transduction histidine kinase
VPDPHPASTDPDAQPPRRSPWPSGGKPLEDELAARAAWLIRLRWWAAGSVFAGALALFLVLPVGSLSPTVPALVIGTLILAYNGLFVRIRRALRIRGAGTEAWGRFASGQFLTDWGALILLVYLTGGVGSPLLFFFVFHAIIASILLPPRAAYGHAVGGIVLVTLLAVLEYTGVLPHRPLAGFGEVRYDDLTAVAVRLGFFASAILFANHLAGSIARRLWARTVELLQMKESVEDAYHRTRTLYDIARAVNGTLDLGEVLQTIVARTTTAMGGKASVLRLLDDEGRALRLSASHGLSDDYLKKGDVDPEKSPVDLSALTGWAVRVADIQDSKAFQYPEAARREGLRSVLVAPLLLRGQSIGVLRLYTGEPREFSDEDVGFLMAIASQGAAAIENARAYRHLEELEEAKAKFVFLVLHELKAPVASVRSSLSLLEEGFLDEVDVRKKALVARMVRRVSGLQDLLKDLMALGSMKGRVPGRGEGQADLAAVVRAAVEGVSLEAEHKGLTVAVNLPGEPLVMPGSAEDLDKIVGNLLHNAVKYTPAGGRVEVSLEQQGEQAVFTCRDTGIGISEEARGHLFQEFFRAGNAKQFAEGTGLGLSLVKRLVEIYHGDVGVVSEVGQGSTFTVTLPLV